MAAGFFVCLTDIARYKNPNFKGLEFDAFKNESGSNAFTLSPQKWISSTNANIAEKSNKRKIEKCQSKFTQRNKRTIKNEIIRTKTSKYSTNLSFQKFL